MPRDLLIFSPSTVTKLLEPEFGEGFIEGGFGLGDFVGVVDGDVVYATGMDVYGFT